MQDDYTIKERVSKGSFGTIFRIVRRAFSYCKDSRQRSVTMFGFLDIQSVPSNCLQAQTKKSMHSSRCPWSTRLEWRDRKHWMRCFIWR